MTIYTPETLAQRWGCSSNNAPNLIKRGELSAFRLGARLPRVGLAAVEAYERSQKTGGGD